MKIFYFTTFLLIALIGAVIYLSVTYQTPNPVVPLAVLNTSTALQTNVISPSQYLPTSPAANPAPKPTPIPTPTPKPNPTPTPNAPGCGSGGACTAAQVATHNTRSNCWVYLSQKNEAYNITAYVQNPGQHPGGDVIASRCGTDITSYFLGSVGGHAHSNGAQKLLETYYVAPMQ